MGASRSHTNCVLYVFDSLRYDHVSCNGYGEDTTPNIDRLAEDGIRFENAFSQAIWTYPSSATIFSGLYPETHRSQQFDQPLDERFPHLADGLGEEDVRTACFSTTMGVSPERGFEQEFDEFYYLGGGRNALRPDIMDQLNERLLPWIRDHADEQFFAVVWAMGTHHPYLTPADVDDPTQPMENDPHVEGASEWLWRQPRDNVDRVRSLYDNAVRYSDARFGELIDSLKADDIYEQTTVVVTADHGEVFDEHARMGYISPVYRSVLERVVDRDRRRELSLFEPAAFLGHQATYPYDELVRVPLVVKPGDRDPGESVFAGAVELVDLLPTIRDTLSVPTPEACQGDSLYEHAAGDITKEYTYSTSQIHQAHLVYRSIRSADHKLCVRDLTVPDFETVTLPRAAKWTASYLLAPNELLLSNEDGIERPITDGPEQKRLRSLLSEHRTRCRGAEIDVDRDPGRIEVDDDTEERLADLGYK